MRRAESRSYARNNSSLQNKQICFVFYKMSTKIIIITFKEAFKLFKDLDLHTKRQRDNGKSDFEIVQTILYHQRIELVKIETLVPGKKLVSSSLILHNLAKVFEGNVFT